MAIGKRVLYSGRVQGVGFRYTAKELAQDFPITGYVRNLSTGQVELVVEGELHDVDAFLDSLGKRMQGYIRAHDVHVQPPGSYEDFSIRL